MPGHKAEAAGERKIHYEHEKLRKIVAIEEYVARMEDVLDLYAATPDPQHPVVCFDESPIQLIGQCARRPRPHRDSRTHRLRVSPLWHGEPVRVVGCARPWRRVTVSERRTASDFARCMRELVMSTIPGRTDPGHDGQPLDAHARIALRGVFPALVGPGRRPWSRSAYRTQCRSVSPEQPILAAIERIASYCEAYSSRCSKAYGTARSRTSGE